MSALSLHQLCIAYGRKNGDAVRDLDLEVAASQLVSLLGPSGCGKTTTMRAIAGLLAPRAGAIRLGGEDITRQPAHRRDIGLVFQSYALFPHLSALDNVAFGLRMRRLAEPEVKRRAEEALAAVGLAALAPRLPAQLSGGQQQRVALARAFVIRPRLLLLDEPLSNLDAALRLEMRAEVRRLQRASGTTMLYVTHDQEEALALSDRIVVMREGRIEQDATPAELYERPATPFVAAFMGCENLFEWRDGALHGAAGSWRLPQDMASTLPAASKAGHLAWRPAAVPVLAAGGAGHLPGTVLARSYLGNGVQYLVRTVLGSVKGTAPPDAPWAEGDAVALHLDPRRAAAIRSSSTSEP